MDRININLLPPELKESKKRERRRSLIASLSIGLLVLMVFITGALLVAVVVQNRRIADANKQLESTKIEVNTYKQREALAVVLKSQLATIDSLVKREFPQAQAFNLINTLTPAGIRIFSFSINKANKIVLQGETTNTFALETFFNNLIDPKFNEGKISKVVIDSLNRDRESKIRFDLSITPSKL